ncbi:alternative ribosome rescue aminoacyl-tRNA hydrolase ArfB [Gemmatimonas sp.]|uniref:alternative ribosome rescue aminoacyl-tRNA hydrolase ArfB n=1 Tax=Gemmatimonas sp. TaxID=1962908 RepID=UPI0022CC7252|nr:alternative ribosome rescue aminoacyl-tRNA hydrolase ArfB [Gemmatimonas sp.]MCZ8205960.1 alternative ribosome rescue aminoacyl-tRNA hydrolase ArfB [Gemmatimonas sp.]
MSDADSSRPPRGEELDGVTVAPGVHIPVAELQLSAIAGGGPGGQHVNRSATRVVLQWNVRSTRALRAEQRERVLEKLASRLDGDGALRIVAGEYRSQLQNRRAALDRLRQLVARALVVPRARKATKPTFGSVQERLSTKRQRAETKRQRRRPLDD